VRVGTVLFSCTLAQSAVTRPQCVDIPTVQGTTKM